MLSIEDFIEGMARAQGTANAGPYDHIAMQASVRAIVEPSPATARRP